nr:iron-containing redox enzyme family protein [Brevibacterium pigmentatum]
MTQTGAIDELNSPAPLTAPERGLMPRPRGEVTSLLLSVLTSDGGEAAELLPELDAAASSALVSSEDMFRDEDLQLALHLLYTLHTGPADFVHGDWEWDPSLIGIRGRIERRFETALRALAPLPDLIPRSGAELAQTLFSMTSEVAQPELATWAAKHASVDQLREFLIHKSIYTLREADPHSWAIPRLRGRAKAALVEIQADEYGGGRPERVHAEIFAQALRGFGLDDRPDHYLDDVPAVTLASVNAMNLFGLNRRLRGAAIGHLAAFEMTSSIPNGLYSRAFSRNGFDRDVTWYFDEHVEADAVHEQIAAHDLAGGAADDEPGLIPDILFGAAACLRLDDITGSRMLAAWSTGASSLRAGGRSL